MKLTAEKNMANDHGNTKGFTLLEVLLVLSIMSLLLLVAINMGNQKIDQMKREKTASDMKQILNAMQAYYVDMGEFPSDMLTLSNGGYLPANITSSYGVGYSIQNGNHTGEVNVTIPATIKAAALNAKIIAGMVPSGFVDNTSKVHAVTTAPGSNLNSAKSVNFSGLYHHGACVPVPSCPAGTQATIMVAPVSVNGVNDQGTPTLYPISSFTAYATGPADPTAVGGVPKCSSNSLADTACYLDTTGGATKVPSNLSPPQKYWRVCLQVITQNGDVSLTNVGTGVNSWGQFATVMAITRCATTAVTVPPGEATGSPFSVFSN